MLLDLTVRGCGPFPVGCCFYGQHWLATQGLSVQSPKYTRCMNEFLQGPLGLLLQFAAGVGDPTPPPAPFPPLPSTCQQAPVADNPTAACFCGSIAWPSHFLPSKMVPVQIPFSVPTKPEETQASLQIPKQEVRLLLYFLSSSSCHPLIQVSLVHRNKGQGRKSTT